MPTPITSSENAYIGGRDTVGSSKPAFIRGLQTITSNKALYVRGHTASTSSKLMYVRGFQSITSLKRAYEHGHIRKFTNHKCFIVNNAGIVTTTSNTNAFISGTGNGTFNKFCFLYGTDGVTANYGWVIKMCYLVSRRRDFYE